MNPVGFRPALRFPSHQKAPGGSPGTPRHPSFGSPRRKPSGRPSAAPGSPRRKPSGCPSPPRPARARPAFTLVELLVVIGIIGLLAALLTPVVMQSLTKARNAAIKAEIDMLHMAIMNYKNEYGSFPPCYDSNPAAPLTSGSITSIAQKHVKRIFPRCNTLSGSTGQFQNAVPLAPTNAIVAWLSGYTSDVTSPLLPLGDRRKLYDFDSSRVSALQYAPAQKRNSPYIYLNASQYQLTVPVATRFSGSLLYSGTTSIQLAEPGVQFVPASPLPVKPNANYPDAWWFTNCTGTQPVFNPDTFQILCAGRDEEFGTDDDLSNFWPGTRREYLDSLKDQ